ncbi:LuxR C-terminal-related transcriptional regulator [Micromonospora sp. NPDC005194]|uniref:response regulator transcription factor n=1 Tax=Micromonospora sp. NPDC005194 TaxID=3156870 RepID=UPI00339EB96E
MVSQVAAGSEPPDPFGRLTPRERDVLHEMAHGLTNAGVAQRSHVSQSAVDEHVNAIFDKLGLAHATGYSRRLLAVLRYLCIPFLKIKPDRGGRDVPIARTIRYRTFRVDRHPTARSGPRRRLVWGVLSGCEARWGVTGCIPGPESWRAGGRYIP